MIPARRPRQLKQSGSVLVLSAALMLILIGFVGLVVDGGEIASTARSAQNAADAAALGAGYYIVNQGDTLANAQALGQTLATQNGVNGTTELTLTFYDASGAVVPVGGSPSSVRSVQADVAHTFPTLFLPIMGINSASVSVHAKVLVTPPSSAGCSLCLLAGSGTALTVSGSGLWVQNGPIGVNSNSVGAITVSSGFLYDSGVSPATTIRSPGTATGCIGFACNPLPLPGGVINDPLSGVAQPAQTLTDQGSFTNNHGVADTIYPGKYLNIDMTSSDNVTMSPGLYVITGRFNDSGSGKLTATGVTLFFACATYPTPCASPGTSGASLSYTGTAQIAMSGQAGGSLQGMAIMFDRFNTAAFTINTASWFQISGTVYAPQQNLTVNSTSGTAVIILSRVVANTLSMTSSAFFYVQYTGSTNFTVPGTLKLTV